MKLDIGNRLLLAFRELLTADQDIAALVGQRVWWYGDETHRAAYPCILVNIPASAPSGIAELGWEEVHLQLLASTYRPDDKGLETLRALVGLLRGFVRRRNLPAELTATTAAKTAESALTVVDARYENDVEQEEGHSTQIYAGITIQVTCAPHNAGVSPGQDTHTGDNP